MSKCKTVQDEKKIRELVVRRRNEEQVVEKRILKQADGRFVEADEQKVEE